MAESPITPEERVAIERYASRQVPAAKHDVKCRYCDLPARLYIIDTDECKSPVCADHYTKRAHFVAHPELGRDDGES